MSRTLNDARIRVAELMVKKNDGTITDQETNELNNCQQQIMRAEAGSPSGQSREQIEKALRDRGLLPQRRFNLGPTAKLALTVIGYVAVAAVGAFGGIQYEKRSERTRMQRNRLTDRNDHGIGDQSGSGSTSLQSHPATSSFGRQGNPGNEGNTTNHPGPGRSRAATANA